MLGLEALYQDPERLVVTGHRGWSGRYPENTLPAFEKAVELGCDIVEFDVRNTADGGLVIMHDISVDRTTDGTGLVRDLSQAAIQQLTASYWEGPHDTGRRRETLVVPEVKVPSLEDTLELLAGRVVMNIQVYATGHELLMRIADLYHHFKLYDQAFLLVETFADAAFFRALNPRIELCIGEDREHPQRHKAFGVRLIQPWRHMITPEYVQELGRLELWANVFYANTLEAVDALWSAGIRGMLSDNPDLLIAFRDREGN